MVTLCPTTHRELKHVWQGILFNNPWLLKAASSRYIIHNVAPLTSFFKNNNLKFSFKIVGFFVPFTLINPLNTLISLFLHPSPPSFYPHIPLCIFIFPYIHSFATIKAYSFQKTFSSVLASTSNPKRSQRIRS